MNCLSSKELKYSKYEIAIDTSFWSESYSQKISNWKLSEAAAPIAAFVSTPLHDSVQLSIPSHVAFLRNDSFLSSGSTSTSSRSVACVIFNGFIKNFNHRETFTELDTENALYYALYQLLLKPLFFTKYASKADEELAWNTMSFSFFSLFSFIDGKNFSFYHREAFPSLKLTSPVCLEDIFNGLANFPLDPGVCEKIHVFAKSRIATRNTPFLCVVDDANHVEFKDFSPFAFADMLEQGKNAFLCFWNFSPRRDKVDTGAKNLINCLRLALPQLQRFRILALQGRKDFCFYATCLCKEQSNESIQHTFKKVTDLLGSAAHNTGTMGSEDAAAGGVDWKSLFEGSPDPVLKASGWITEDGRVEHLNAIMNPEERAIKGALCNLQLIKWREAPGIELDSIQQCKALLLGTGTLGCNVARNLLMWGVRHITLVDRSCVSYSNLGRQTLFSFDDAKNGVAKCVAAANALRDIIPGLHVEPVSFSIPTPGSRAGAGEQQVAERVALLTNLITSHDVVFLLTDSRESRWLPSLLAAAHGTPVINVALGFDAFLVRRHGVVSATSGSNVVGPDHGEEPLSCYFCKDIYAPSTALLSNTLDRQCTVTRPGVSSIASALAVEMLASLYQHPAGFRFQCRGVPEGRAGCLGVVPSIMRGDVYHYRISHEDEERSSRCSVCSDAVLRQYRAHRADFIMKCLEDPGYLEEICGLKEQRCADAPAPCDLFSDFSSDDES